MPERLIERSKILELQWNNIKTLIPCLLKSLYTGSIELRLHELDKVFTGIVKIKDVPESNILGKVASLWYYLTRVFHQSMGPRLGGFAEELITYLVGSGGKYKVIGRNMTLGKALRELVNVGVERRNMIDFIFRGNDSLALVELRMSEHTGGRTGQQSLLDKIDYILGVLEEERVRLRQRLIDKGIRELSLSIVILFSESHELLTKENVDRGRLTSLISYIMDERHVGGSLKKLSEGNRYRMCDGATITFERVKRELFDIDNRKVCIKESSSDFRVWLKILLGDEFFNEYARSNLSDILARHGDIIADDIWLFYTLLINELKVARQFGYTHVRRVYEDLKLSNIFGYFYNNVYNNTELPLESYIQQLNRWIEGCANTVIKVYREKGQQLRLLETNDLIANFEYLKQVCICVLALHLTLIRERNLEFRECRWE
ncbi:MAG: hypothetical protein ACO2O0_08775 [Desulfurococcales archaeon]|jgi:hypothetical protein